MLKLRRALVSVSDKRDLTPFATKLHDLGVEIWSTGGTFRSLASAGVPAIEVASKTGFPEIMGGRVKTLHPVVHGGLLGRRGIDETTMDEHGIEPIDLLVVNLYPFEETVNQPGTTLGDAIENIDIGGPAMIRAASKNHDGVAVVVDPNDYQRVLAAIEAQDLSLELRRELAQKAFAHTAAYDVAIARYLSGQLAAADDIGERALYAGSRVSSLRYGENPHQVAAFYRDQKPTPGSLAGAEQLQGKEMSYNNIADADAALECVRQFAEPGCVIVKHANPCGVALRDTSLAAYEAAFRTDPTSAFGGVIAFNREVDGDTAQTIVDRQFVEVVIAPEFSPEATAAFGAKQNVRVLRTGEKSSDGGRLEYKKVSGGLLVQTVDDGRVTAADLEVVTERAPSAEQMRDLLFAWQVVKYVKSNAIVFCKELMTIGIGAGQMSRVYSTKIAAIKAADERLEVAGSVMASDAFFPFRDGIDTAAEHGIAAIIQPGGSIRDDEVVAAANEHGLAMVFTGMRHFRH